MYTPLRVGFRGFHAVARCTLFGLETAPVPLPGAWRRFAIERNIQKADSLAVVSVCQAFF